MLMLTRVVPGSPLSRSCVLVSGGVRSPLVLGGGALP